MVGINVCALLWINSIIEKVCSYSYGGDKQVVFSLKESRYIIEKKATLAAISNMPLKFHPTPMFLTKINDEMD